MRRKRQKHNNKKRVFANKVELLFSKWLIKNMAKFNHQPLQIKKDEYRFTGVIKNIILKMDFVLPEAMLFFNNNKGKNFDHKTIAYIGDKQYNSDLGYYDADRTDSIYTYFPTQEELYIKEVFEPIINYCNSNLVTGNSLYLEEFEACTTGFISSSESTNHKKETCLILEVLQ